MAIMAMSENRVIYVLPVFKFLKKIIIAYTVKSFQPMTFNNKYYYVSD